MKIVYMGTPDFAVPSLQMLIENHYDVVGVYTQPDKPKGRKYVLTPPPVKEYAFTHNIPVYQPESFKKQTVIDELREINPDLIVVVAYGKLLPKTVLDIPKYGCINLHGSLLPKYRGAAPIQWSVLNGDKTAGATTMYMTEGLDTGDMILTYETQIGVDETSSELFGRLKLAGAGLLLDTIKLIENKTATRTQQNDQESCYAPMLSKSMSEIDFSKSAQQVHNQIRGLSDWPCATTKYASKPIKVYKSTLVEEFHGNAGEILDDKRFIVGCGDKNAIEFLEVQLEGGKRISSKSFLLGRKIVKGEQLK